jgi:hypothetical protein
MVLSTCKTDQEIISDVQKLWFLGNLEGTQVPLVLDGAKN